MEEIRQAQIYGVRPSRTFEQAAAKFVIENQHKRSIDDDIGRLKGLMPWIGAMPLEKIHMGSLQPWIESRQKKGVSAGTIRSYAALSISLPANGSAMRGLHGFRRRAKSSFFPIMISASLTLSPGRSRSAYFGNCLSICRKWRSLPSIRAAGMQRYVVCAGTMR